MRKFLVILDDSQECLNAMRFAAMRAARTGGGVEVLAVIPPEEFNHWIGVSDIMRSEARERIEVHFEVFAKWMRDKQGVDPELVIREGEPVDEILKQVREDTDVGVLVLGASTTIAAWPSTKSPRMVVLYCRMPSSVIARTDLRIIVSISPIQTSTEPRGYSGLRKGT